VRLMRVTEWRLVCQALLQLHLVCAHDCILGCIPSLRPDWLCAIRVPCDLDVVNGAWEVCNKQNDIRWAPMRGARYPHVLLSREDGRLAWLQSLLLRQCVAQTSGSS
jgi:hypothetical protein